MISTVLTGITDEKGNVVQQGYSVSELQVGGGPGLSGLADAVQKIFVHQNDPGFSVASNYEFTDGGPGLATGYRAVVPATEVDRVKSAFRLGMGHLPENSGRLMSSNTKLLMWHNWSDEALTPYNSINYYKRLAKDHGGYAKVQEKARLFMIPATSHCSIGGIGPNNFDALSAIEN